MAGLLDDIGKGIMDAASSAVTGMSNDERDDLVRDMMSGKMDFNSYLKISMMMQSQGGASGIFNSVTNIPGLQQSLGLDGGQVDEAEVKLAEYSKIIAAMSEEERGQPGFFLVGQGVDERVARLAKDAEIEEALVKQFLSEFKQMKEFFLKLGVGLKAGKTKEQVIKELEREAKAKEAAEEEGGAAKPKVGGGQVVNPERQKKKLAARAKAAARRSQARGGRRR